MSLEILITRFSSSEIRNGSLLVQVKFTHVVGGVVSDAPVACVLSKVSSTLRLGLVLLTIHVHGCWVHGWLTNGDRSHVIRRAIGLGIEV